MDLSQDKPSNRQVFDVQQDKDEDNDEYFTVDKPHVAMTIWNLLITGTCIGLFSYVNSYFAITLHNFVDGTSIGKSTQSFSCDQYYCDQTLYNCMNYYTYYQQCNQRICTDVVCTTYSSECGNDKYYPDLNRYFACEPMCPDYNQSRYPAVVLVAYGLAIAAAICFAIFLIVPIFMGIVLNIKSKQITPKERIGLLLWFLWPALKYYFLRQRKDWGDFDLNLKAVVTADYICAVSLSITMTIYVWFYSVGTWFDNKQISLFFILLGAFISHWLLCWSNGRTFWKAKQRFS